MKRTPDFYLLTSASTWGVSIGAFLLDCRWPHISLGIGPFLVGVRWLLNPAPEKTP